MAELAEFKAQMKIHVDDNKLVLDNYLEEKSNAFFEKLEIKLVKTFDNFLSEFKEKVVADIQANTDQIVSLRAESDRRDARLEVLEKEVLKQKRGNLEQGVHDRKRDIIISDLELHKDDTPTQVDAKIRNNFVNKLGLSTGVINDFIFTARHPLGKPKNGKPPKVIAVLLDLDHVNTVFNAARKKGPGGQHIQTHLPQELQKWKNRCLFERRNMLNSGADRSEVRIRDFKGFSKLQVKHDTIGWVDKLEYVVSLDDKVNFPEE